jgi:AcrR family transcriptional regulator
MQGEQVVPLLTQPGPLGRPVEQVVGGGVAPREQRFQHGDPHFEVMFRLDALDPANADFAAASETAYGLVTATIERCRAAGRLHGRPPELVAVSAWSLVHGLAALWISGRLTERISEHDPRRLAAAVSDLFTEAVLPPRDDLR